MGNYILEKSDYTHLMKVGINSINKKKSKNIVQLHKAMIKSQKQYNKYHKEKYDKYNKTEEIKQNL